MSRPLMTAWATVSHIQCPLSEVRAPSQRPTFTNFGKSSALAKYIAPIDLKSLERTCRECCRDFRSAVPGSTGLLGFHQRCAGIFLREDTGEIAVLPLHADRMTVNVLAVGSEFDLSAGRHGGVTGGYVER